jgi:hypothetical protein
MLEETGLILENKIIIINIPVMDLSNLYLPYDIYYLVSDI